MYVDLLLLLYNGFADLWGLQIEIKACSSKSWKFPLLTFPKIWIMRMWLVGNIGWQALWGCQLKARSLSLAHLRLSHLQGCQTENYRVTINSLHPQPNSCLHFQCTFTVEVGKEPLKSSLTTSLGTHWSLLINPTNEHAQTALVWSIAMLGDGVISVKYLTLSYNRVTIL